MNVERMRRYIARTTPDRVVGLFDLLSDNLQDQQDQFVRNFMHKMSIKHGPDGRVDIYLDEQLATHPGEVAVVLVARPNQRR